jgi:phage terminase large subunit
VKIGELEPFLCASEACALRQMDHAVWVEKPRKKSGKQLVYVPTPKGVDFENAKQWNVLFGGAAGGSKSYGGRWWLHKRCLQWPRHRALLVRNKLTELKDTHIQEGLEFEEELLGAKLNRTDLTFTYPNGSILQMGHMGDITSYLSTQYDDCLCDEIVTLPERETMLLRSRIGRRRSHPSRFAGATNPGGKDAFWVKQRWVTQDVAAVRETDKTYDPEQWEYIQARVEDNPYLDERYAEILAGLPEDLREAYLEGNWDIFPGQFFTEWRASIMNKPYHVAPHMDYDRDLPRVCSIDWGYVKPGAVGWYVLLPDGHVFKEAEWIFQREQAPDVARKVAKHREEHGLTNVRYVGDTQMWIPGQQEKSESIAETFARYGVSLAQANKDRINGWVRLRAWFREAPDGRPWLSISERCVYTARTVPAMVMDEHKPEDLDTESEDHAVDEMRYFAMSRPNPSDSARIVIAPKPGTVGALKAEIAKRTMEARWHAYPR